MANSISYAKAYKDKLDEIFKAGAVTAMMEAAEGTYKFNPENAQEILLQKVSVNGLGDYSRSNGYVSGDATVTWETHSFGQDRARKFNLDTMDAKEAMFMVGRLMAEIMRTQIIPEIDAYRFHKICNLCSVDATADLTVDTVVNAIDTGVQTLNDAEVPEEGRVLFLSNTVDNLLKNSGEFYKTRVTHDNAVQKIQRKISMLDDMPIIRVPKARFYSAFDFYDGESGGETAGGFTPSAGSKELNFMIVPIQYVIGVIRHMDPKLIQPQYNADHDGWIFAPRLYHELFIPENKLGGIYIHKKSS
ncbi:MAG: hypothetical protein PVJ67_04985 [Candidatus Pacearchaeota archaeon]|jgi:hypothetical protein